MKSPVIIIIREATESRDGCIIAKTECEIAENPGFFCLKVLLEQRKKMSFS